MDEFQILNFDEAFKLWKLSRSDVDSILATCGVETDKVITVANAESSAWLEGYDARSNAEKRLKGPPVPDVLEQQAIQLELQQKLQSLADQVQNVRQAAASKLQGAKRKIELDRRAKFKAQLMNPNDSVVANTLASTVPKRYYVIVGRGTAAILNHTTLRQTQIGKDRLKDPKNTANILPVLHIGLTDPWYLYQAHGMGQPRHLLVLPGYHYRPGFLDRTIRSGMHSWDFAFKNLQEWALLKMKFGFEHVEGWVALIQKKGQETAAWVPPPIWNEPGATGVRDQLILEWAKPFAVDSAYRLLVVLPSASVAPTTSVILVYAEKVDICTGLGRAAVVPGTPHAGLTGLVAEARSRLWEPPEEWTDTVKNRRVITGPEALFMVTPWNAAHRIFVSGAGGIGLNMVERAEDEGCAIDWLHYQFLHQNSFGLERNDTVLKNLVTQRPCLPGESGLRNPADGTVKNPEEVVNIAIKNLYPAYPQWRFGRNAQPTFPGVVDIGTTRLKIPITPKADCTIHDYFQQEVALVGGAFPFSPQFTVANPALSAADAINGIYDRLFICAGMADDVLGSTKCMAADARFTFTPKEADGVAVALEADGGAVRILGGAVTIRGTFPALLPNSLDTPTKRRLFNLPVSAVAPGFIYHGLNIATANGWFAGQKNTNANTATADEIKQALVAKGVAADVAEELGRAVVVKRRLANGFDNTYDLLKALETDAELVKKTGWRLAAYSLDLTYREAGKFLD